jgi:hypothetical protein
MVVLLYQCVFRDESNGHCRREADHITIVVVVVVVVVGDSSMKSRSSLFYGNQT